MNKKTILKMLLLMCMGGVVGAVVTIGLFFMDDGYGYVFKNIGDFIVNVSPFLYPVLLMLMFLPAVYLFNKGKKLLVDSKKMDEEEMDSMEKESSKYLDLSVAFNGVYMIANFLLLGATIQKGSDYYFLVLFMFLINTVLASGMEIVVVRFIQKNDERLKGDPTSFKFQKDYVASCDEAEQYRIYKSGYGSFQFSRSFTFAMILVCILFNLVLDTGAFPVVITCLIGFSQIISYNVYNFKYANQ